VGILRLQFRSGVRLTGKKFKCALNTAGVNACMDGKERGEYIAMEWLLQCVRCDKPSSWASVAEYEAQITSGDHLKHYN
jgi:hypothetical protein